MFTYPTTSYFSLFCCIQSYNRSLYVTAYIQTQSSRKSSVVVFLLFSLLLMQTQTLRISEYFSDRTSFHRTVLKWIFWEVVWVLYTIVLLPCCLSKSWSIFLWTIENITSFLIVRRMTNWQHTQKWL